jgi:glycosyltransferase involved in cell wall biosynthesis
MVGDVNVFISDFSKRLWDIQLNSMVIHHGIDTELFCPNGMAKQKHALTVGNDFINRNYCLHYDWWCELIKDIEGKIVGETEGVSKPAKDINELVNEYNECGVYINTSTTPIPMSLLEAMSCGCAVVTVNASMMPEIINNGSNGFISNDLSELKSYINQILSDNDLRDQLGSNARKTILNKFSEDKFIENWNELFNMIYEVGSK